MSGHADRNERCPNPYCDSTGWVRCDATATTHAYMTPACKVGPHTTPEVESVGHRRPA